jgi:hypothetical protein
MPYMLAPSQLSVLTIQIILCCPPAYTPKSWCDRCGHGARAVASLEQFVSDFAMHIAPLTPDIARHAASLRAQTLSLHLPDAFVLATGDVLGATSVITGDSALANLSPRVQLL